MQIKCSIKFLLFLITIVSFASFKKEIVEPELSVSQSTIAIPVEGNTSEITIASNDSWSINNPASAWLQLNQVNGNSGSATIQIIAGHNNTGSTRSTVLTVNSDNGQSRRVNVSQPSQLYPSY